MFPPSFNSTIPKTKKNDKGIAILKTTSSGPELDEMGTNSFNKLTVTSFGVEHIKSSKQAGYDIRGGLRGGPTTVQLVPAPLFAPYNTASSRTRSLRRGVSPKYGLWRNSERKYGETPGFAVLSAERGGGERERSRETNTPEQPDPHFYLRLHHRAHLLSHLSPRNRSLCMPGYSCLHRALFAGHFDALFVRIRHS